MSAIKRNFLPLLLLTIAAILVASLAARPAAPASATGKAGVAFVTDGTPTATEVDWSMIGQAIAAIISAIAGVVQLIRDLFSKPTSASSQLIQDTIQHGGTLVPAAETLGDDIVAFTGQTGSGPAHELAMRVAGEKLLKKYTITVKP